MSDDKLKKVNENEKVYSLEEDDVETINTIRSYIG